MATIHAKIYALSALLMLAWGDSPPVAADTIYKWRDARGHIHYGDHAPTNAASATERVPTTLSPTPDADAKQRRVLRNRLLESFAHERAAKRTELAKSDALRARDKAACSRIRARLAALQQAGSIFQTKADGQRIYFTDAQRARMLHDARNTIREHCD